MSAVPSSGLSLAVIVPTLRRPDYLRSCLLALARQRRPVDCIVVTAKEGDSATSTLCAELSLVIPHLQLVLSSPTSNLVDQINLAISHTTQDVVAFTDDDSEAHEDWSEQLIRNFADTRVGGVGGRDWQAHARNINEAEVGVIRWWGKIVGNHHVGAGPARSVDVLKGVNMAFRGDVVRPLGVDSRLWGRGMVFHYELSLSLTVRRLGWRLLYDPAVALEHNIAPIMDGDTTGREGFDKVLYRYALHNNALAVMEYLTLPRSTAYLLWSFFIGSRGEVGLLQIVRLTAKGQSLPVLLQKFVGNCVAKVSAIRTLLRTRSAHQVRLAKVPRPPANGKRADAAI